MDGATSQLGIWTGPAIRAGFIELNGGDSRTEFGVKNGGKAERNDN